MKQPDRVFFKMNHFLEALKCLETSGIISPNESNIINKKCTEAILKEDYIMIESLKRDVRSMQRKAMDTELQQLLDASNSTNLNFNQTNLHTADYSSIFAAASSGIFGVVSTLIATNEKNANIADRSPIALWNIACNAAEKGYKSHQEDKKINHLVIEHIYGDEFVCDTITVCINGFMTRNMGEQSYEGWIHWAKYLNATCYKVNWETGDISEWETFFSQLELNNMNPSSASTSFSHFLRNPFRKAQHKAESIGKILGSYFSTNPIIFRNKKVVLMGHSLGATIIYYILTHLRDKNIFNLINGAYFFGGAFVPDNDKVKGFSQVIDVRHNFIDTHGIYNFYSRNDMVLKAIFSIANLSYDKAAGIRPIHVSSVIKNIDITTLLPVDISTQFGHSYNSLMDMIIIHFSRLFQEKRNF